MSSEKMDSKFEALCGDEVNEERRTAIRAAIECIGDVSAREFMDTLAFSV
jgi:hypothetical protein